MGASADGASALAAFVLGARPGEVVLDMCAVSSIPALFRQKSK